MNYEEFLTQATSEGLNVKKYIRGNNGRILGKRIAIRKDIKTSAEKDDRIVELEAQVVEMQVTIDDLQKQLEEALAKLSSNNTDKKFIEDIKVAITGAVGEGEFITDVVFIDGDLCVYVDLMQSDPSPFTYEDLALTRTSSITDEILSLNEYFDLWNTVTVDFGSLGRICNDKTNISDDGYGSYFNSTNFILE